MKWFDNARGWGLLLLEDGSPLFVHQRDLALKGFRVLRPGEEVDCEIAEDEHGRHAVDVRVRPPA